MFFAPIHWNDQSVLVIILAVPAAEFSGKMVDVVELSIMGRIPTLPAAASCQTAQPDEIPDVAARVLRIVVVTNIRDEDLVSTAA